MSELLPAPRKVATTSIQVYIPVDVREEMLSALAPGEDGTTESLSSFVRKAILRALAHRKATA